jgi:hypothetical protein
MKLVCYTPSCQQILIELLDNEKFRKGWCIPAYETIMGWTGLSRSTIYRSLRTLADIGMIEWIRRFIYTQDKDVGRDRPRPPIFTASACRTGWKSWWAFTRPCLPMKKIGAPRLPKNMQPCLPLYRRRNVAAPCRR